MNYWRALKAPQGKARHRLHDGGAVRVPDGRWRARLQNGTTHVCSTEKPRFRDTNIETFQFSANSPVFPIFEYAHTPLPCSHYSLQGSFGMGVGAGVGSLDASLRRAYKCVTECADAPRGRHSLFWRAAGVSGDALAHVNGLRMLRISVGPVKQDSEGLVWGASGVRASPRQVSCLGLEPFHFEGSACAPNANPNASEIACLTRSCKRG